MILTKLMRSRTFVKVGSNPVTLAVVIVSMVVFTGNVTMSTSISAVVKELMVKLSLRCSFLRMK